jgi:DNA-binding transcriptional regulator YiaG
MQLHELEAWLGDYDGLTDEQFSDLLDQANDIEDRYPDPDDQAALSAAYRLMAEPVEGVLADYGQQRAAARAAVAATSAALQQAARTVVTEGKLSEAGFARVADVDRMTVRKWLGKK